MPMNIYIWIYIHLLISNCTCGNPSDYSYSATSLSHKQTTHLYIYPSQNINITAFTQARTLTPVEQVSILCVCLCVCVCVCVWPQVPIKLLHPPPPPVCQSGRHQISWCGQIDKQAGTLSSLEVPGARPPATHSPAPGASGCFHSIDYVSLRFTSHLLCFASWKHVGGDRKLRTVSATALTPVKTVIPASSAKTMDTIWDSRQNERLASFVSRKLWTH